MSVSSIMERIRFSGLLTFGILGFYLMCFLRVLQLTYLIPGRVLHGLLIRSTMSTEWISEIRKTKGKTEMHLLMERFISEMKFNYSSNSVRTPLCSS